MQNSDDISNIETQNTNSAAEKSAVFDLCVAVIFGLITAAAFVVSLTYDFVSARAPLVILAPMLILLGVQIKYSWSASRGINFGHYLQQIVQGRNQAFNSSAGFFGWVGLLLIMIFVTGHYAGIAAFMFMLIYMVANENLKLSISVAGGITLLTYLMFEHVFNIQLYRGLIYRVWAGYGIF